MSEMFTIDFTPPFKCPKGCDMPGGTFARQSIVWAMNTEKGVATTKCVLCNVTWAWNFHPDKPLEHQKLELKCSESAPDSKPTKKKRK